MDEWIKKMWYTNEMEYYLAIKKNKGTCLVEVVKNPPANTGSTGLIPGPGGFHMLQSI